VITIRPRVRSGAVGWDEVASEVFQRRYDPLDVSVCVIRSPDGIGLVDTRSSPRQADELRTHLRELGHLQIRWVVNTHAHFDHCFGNQRFAPALGVPVYGHSAMPAHLDRFERPLLAGWIAAVGEQSEEWREVTITPPTNPIESQNEIALGDRAVRLLHLGRGHTDNDLVVHIPDTGTWLVGDLIEESGPPAYGLDSFPIEWPATVARLLTVVGGSDVLVPGHGGPVDPPFARSQQAQLAGMAELIAELHAAGVPASRAAAVGGARWPLPAAGLAAAIEAGYAQLGDQWAR
jgi:glyoxylase-like metal-dependent hydrolase (beta-lactamase superfamily II)